MKPMTESMINADNTKPNGELPARMSRMRFTALLIFTQVPSVFAFTIPLPLLARMAEDFSHDPGSGYLTRMVSGILGPAMALGAPLGGWLSDKFDRRTLLVVIGAVYLLCGVAPAFLDQLGVIVATRFATGLAGAAMMVIGMTMVGDYLPEAKRAGTIGLLSAVNMIASLSTLPVAGLVGDSGWRLAFLLYLLALPVILLAGPSSLPVPAKPAFDHRQEQAKAPWYKGLPWPLFLLAGGIGVILTIPGIYVSFHLATIGLGKSSTVGLLMMLNSTIAAASAAVFGKIWARSVRAVFCLGLSAMALGLGLLAMASQYPVAIAAMILMGAGMGLLAPSVMAATVATVEEGQRGRLVGLIQGTMSVAPLLVLSGLEPVIPLLGTKGVMLVIGALTALMAAWFAMRPAKAHGPAAVTAQA
jgi:MFS family permease